MKAIHQFLDTLIPGDAIGNYTLQIHHYLRSQGINSNIYVNFSSIKEGHVIQFRGSDDFLKNDGLIFHHSTYTPFMSCLPSVKSKMIMIYHNITPAAYFKDYNPEFYSLFREAERQNHLLQQIPFISVIGDSKYNLESIKDYINHIPKKEITPPFLKLPVSNIYANPFMTHRLKDGKFTFLFVGRIAPNKKQADLIKFFEYYSKYVNPQSKLIIAGSYSHIDNYFQYILSLLKKRSIKNVLITGKLSEADLVACYKAADCFISMSEHEGFCIPILEAIHKKVPVIAYDIPAIRELLDEKYLFKTKNFVTISKIADTIRTNEQFREAVIADQQTLLNKYDEKALKITFNKILKKSFHI